MMASAIGQLIPSIGPLRVQRQVLSFSQTCPFLCAVYAQQTVFAGYLWFSSCAVFVLFGFWRLCVLENPS